MIFLNPVPSYLHYMYLSSDSVKFLNILTWFGSWKDVFILDPIKDYLIFVFFFKCQLYLGTRVLCQSYGQSLSWLHFLIGDLIAMTPPHLMYLLVVLFTSIPRCHSTILAGTRHVNIYSFIDDIRTTIQLLWHGALTLVLLYKHAKHALEMQYLVQQTQYKTGVTVDLKFY